MADDTRMLELLERATAEALEGDARENGAFWSILHDAAAAVPVDEVLAIATTFCAAQEPAMRATGAGLIAELCNPGRELLGEALGVLEPLLAREQEADVIRVALHGIAMVALPDALPTVLGLVSHHDADVRLDATHALYWCAGEPASRTAVDALISRTRDPDEDVRDWATFGLGTHITADDDAVRDALAARLVDDHLEVREEAAVGLARRGDARAVEAVRELLDADGVSQLTIEAAGHLGDECFLRPLVELGEWWEDESDVLRLAIARCDPAARARFDERTAVLMERLSRDFEGALPGSRLDDLRTAPAFLDLTRELAVDWTDVSGSRRAGVWSLEDLYARPDVRDDPARAAALILAQVRD